MGNRKDQDDNQHELYREYPNDPYAKPPEDLEYDEEFDTINDPYGHPPLCDEEIYNSSCRPQFFSWKRSNEVPLKEIVKTSFECDTPMTHKVTIEKNRKGVVTALIGANTIEYAHNVFERSYKNHINKFDADILKVIFQEREWSEIRVRVWDNNFNHYRKKKDAQSKPSIYTWRYPDEVPLPRILETAINNDSDKIYNVETTNEDISIIVGAKNELEAKNFLSERGQSSKITEWPKKIKDFTTFKDTLDRFWKENKKNFL